MRKALKLDGQMRALALSLGGAVLMAIVAMIIPVSVFETITGATGISEIVPATAAPLGDTARAIIAFLFAAGAFALLAAILLRQPSERNAVRPAIVPTADAGLTASVDSKPSLLQTLREKITTFTESRRTGPVVTELSDLPKLRAVDAHPDAPPRRPISAHRDFGEVDTGLALPVAPAAEPEVVKPAVLEQEVLPPVLVELKEAVALPAPEPQRQPQPEPTVSFTADTGLSDPEIDTVSAMVEKLELALTRRQSQLEHLEILAMAQKSAVANKAEIAEPSLNDLPSPPALEVVQTKTDAVDADTEMDEALRSALETLQRMNVRSR